MRSGFVSQRLANNVKRFLSVFMRFRRFLSVLSVLDAFRIWAGTGERGSTQLDCVERRRVITRMKWANRSFQPWVRFEAFVRARAE